MPSIDTVVIGAGHAGLAVSRCLTDRGIEHVVLERGRLAERWRSARWDSFRLLTPRWLARLPGWAYEGPDRDGFMSSAEFVRYLESYAQAFTAPVLDRTTVLRVGMSPPGYRVDTDRGVWLADHVVIATGEHAAGQVPPYAAGLGPHHTQLTPAGYRAPGQLADEAVLVVGASASGVQIADEIARSGRPVTLAVGAHTRLPRRYRERDIFWWLDRLGSLDRTIDELPDPDRARREPSLQLAGTDRPVDLAALHGIGVRVAGRLAGIDGGVAEFADDLGATMAAAHARLRRVLSTVEECARRSRLNAAMPPEMPPPPPAPIPVPVPTDGGARLDLRRAGVGTVIWATGFRPSYPWLAVPVLTADGRLRHRHGVTSAPGLYAVGLRFQYRRSSTLIDGARHDAASIVDHIAARRRNRRRVHEEGKV